ncbi:hypothetical protein C7974DRAFT_381731 [Boeremia exigua]|uniref:uncharacterized protein n=1 Tax=Boeremia exigua TaxID=749465 RepID=UPI001E8CD0B5|nr:uncharacterized protein C7974DRAFT_381731 [Boeremia exigua]KAH6643536.1 hypothetical protein C7974DRAFT_381731 [Boeremia exigua]
MANNHFPPGMPFPFAFPQMQQPQNGQHDGQPPAPPPPPGWNMPGLQQYPPQPYAPQPGHAENQNNLPQFPPAALNWPPQWLQAMQSGMQSGMVPPPLPGLHFPPPSLPHTPQAPPTPIAFHPHVPPPFPRQPPIAPASAPFERVQEVMDSDREDGEVSDPDRKPGTPAGLPIHAARQRYPAPPRSAPQPTAAPAHVEDAYNPDKPSAGQTVQQAPAVNVSPQVKTAVSEADTVQLHREEVKQFIRILNANNVGYHALAKENVDLELLRSLYISMNLPSEPAPIPPPKTNGTAATKPSANSQPSTPVPSISQKTVPPVSTNVAAASAAPSPVDRKDYLARLQAAKLARKSGPAKASPPQKSPTVAAAFPAAGTSTPQAVMTPTKKPPVTDEQKARQTELIKQRLEALKAQSKQNAAPPNSAAQKHSQPLGSQPQTTGTGSSAPQTPAAGFPGIPGLFMNAPVSSSNGTTTPSRQPQAIPQKRPAPSDTSMSTPRGSVTPYNRPYVQSPHAHQDDSMIIEVSDDESNGSDMDIDDDQAPSGIQLPPSSIPGFPPRQAPVASTVSTPGPQTPATLARTGELSTKEQELAALKLTLKKKLAEQKRIKEAAEAATATASATTTSATTTQQDTPSKPQRTVPPAPASNGPTPSSKLGGESSRDRKRRRRTEIQEQLPTLDDEIANNEVEMARLAKDLERLKADNDRIMQDKQRLTQELEDLGIDTEGMSHADMQATKDEIERAMSPEVENAPQIGDGVSQELALETESVDSITAPVHSEDMTATGANLQTPVSDGSLRDPPQFGFLPGLGQSAPNVSASTALHSAAQPAREQFGDATHDSRLASDLPESAEAPGHVGIVNDRASATPMDDDEDFYSPPPVDVNVEVVAAPSSEPQGEQRNANPPSPSEEGEVEMSESSEEESEEEYEPEEPVVDESFVDDTVLEAPAIDRDVTASQHAQLPEPPVDQSQSIGQSQVSTEDEEAYEPPDVDKEMSDVASSVYAAQPEVSSPEDADDGAMDLASSSSDTSDDSDSESDGEIQSELGDSESQVDVAQHDTKIADDLAPELQPPASSVAVSDAETHTAPAVEDAQPPAFTPYKSPLRFFKSYRYHPNFSQEVDGGFLSMTYSHQIDDSKPLCPFESAGGSCNDPECPNQHFRGMGITGEKLLVQLGTANPGKTQEEKQQWNDGLRSVLKDLRQRSIKDPNGIAREIAKYRRQFLNDDTRVVNL